MQESQWVPLLILIKEQQKKPKYRQMYVVGRSHYKQSENKRSNTKYPSLGFVFLCMYYRLLSKTLPVKYSFGNAPHL